MSSKESVTLEHLLQYTYFPIIAEVEQDTRVLSSKSSTKKLERGDLLWLLRYCQDEDTGNKAVRVCRFDAPNLEFPVVVGDSIKVFRRTYADIRHELGMKGPLMNISELANLVEKESGKEVGERPVFAVSNDDHGNKNERILIHSKEKSKGYLATGKSGKHLMIPNAFNGPFVETKPSAPIKLPTFRKVLDIVKSKWLGEITVGYSTPIADPHVEKIYKDDILKLKDTSIRPRNGFSSGDFVMFKRLRSKEGSLGEIRVSTTSQGLFLATEAGHDSNSNRNDAFILKDFKGSFPAEVTFTGSNSDPYLLSLDEDTLRKESPLKIVGICTYSAIYTSLQLSDSSATPFQSSQMYPDYSPMKVRAATPLPVHVNVLKTFCKPQETVHVLNKNEYDALIKTVASSRPKTIVDNRTTLYSETQIGDKDKKNVFSVLGKELSNLRSSKTKEGVPTDDKLKKRNRTWTTGSFRNKQKRQEEEDEEPIPPARTLGRRRSKSSASAAEFLKKKHEMKKRPVPPPPPRKPSKDLSNSMPDLSHIKTRKPPPSMWNRPVPAPPGIQITKDMSDSLPDVREESSSSQLLTPPTRHRLRRRSSVPNLKQTSDDEDDIDEDDYMDMTTLVRMRMDLLNGT
ncbi:uncharacterized protein [Amphiura filiformis]|uniref:uncharacterized protein n=1 Tax=Amphiura filiformis TaxID=82378 RepID=UPI003B210E31